jgi:hypothetical protein
MTTKDQPRPAAVIVIVAGGRCLRVGQIDGSVPCDLALVEHLLRLRLAARRRGWAIRLVELRSDLRELVELVGVVDLLEGRGPPGADPGVDRGGD